MEAPLATSLAIACIAFTGIWLINVATRDAGIVDYYWGPGFAVIAVVHALMTGISGTAQWLLLAAVSLWAFRLAFHLISRHAGSTGEDARYAAMRASGGETWWWVSLFKVFLLQGVLQWMIAAPVHAGFSEAALGAATGVLFWAGMAIFAAGLAIEWIADLQLSQAKADLSGRTGEPVLYEGGLWGLVRHPNYSGEIMLWWGLALAAHAVSGLAIAFAGPVILTLAIAFVSVPLTEQHMARSRPGFARYAARVPALVPGLRAGSAAGGTDRTVRRT